MKHKLDLTLTDRVQVNEYTSNEEATVSEKLSVNLMTDNLDDARDRFDHQLDRFFDNLKDKQRQLVKAAKQADREKKEAEKSKDDDLL